VQIILPSCTTQQHESTTTPVFSQTRLEALEVVARADAARMKATERVTMRRFMENSFLIVERKTSTRGKHRRRIGGAKALESTGRTGNATRAAGTAGIGRSTISRDGSSARTADFGAKSASESLQKDAGQLSHAAEPQGIESAAADPTVRDPSPRSAIMAAVRVRRAGLRQEV
jgi:hypothetical protein